MDCRGTPRAFARRVKFLSFFVGAVILASTAGAGGCSDETPNAAPYTYKPNECEATGGTCRAYILQLYGGPCDPGESAIPRDCGLGLLVTPTCCIPSTTNGSSRNENEGDVPKSSEEEGEDAGDAGISDSPDAGDAGDGDAR